MPRASVGRTRTALLEGQGGGEGRGGGRRAASAKEGAGGSGRTGETSSGRVSPSAPDAGEAKGRKRNATAPKGEEEEKGADVRIDKIVARRLLPPSDWAALCASMYTAKVTRGSRWLQGGPAPAASRSRTGTTAAAEEREQERFLVKWAGLSYLHCSWETEQDLRELCAAASAQLTKFRRRASGGRWFGADERRGGDYFDPAWTTVDRVLGVVEDSRAASSPNLQEGTGRRLRVKWGRRPYAEATVEHERDLLHCGVEYAAPLASYRGRREKPTREEVRKRDREAERQGRELYRTFGDAVRGRSGKEKERRVQEHQQALEEKVFKDGGRLRDYQAEGVSWLLSNHVNKRGSILADEMGLGKTVQTAIFVHTVARHLTARSCFLIVAPLSTVPHWLREFTGWTDLNTIVYHGNASDRRCARENEFVFPADHIPGATSHQRYLHKVAEKWRANWERTWMVDVVITTPEMLVTDDYAELAAIEWEVLVVDEAHRLKNHSSKLAQNLRNRRFKFKHSLMLTGTPIQNNMQELWTLLNFINPHTFDSLDHFMDQYGDIKSKERVDELHESIRPYILRRLKEDVEKAVPPKEETIIEVELTIIQKQYYRALYEKNLKFLHRNSKRPADGPSINNLAMQLRKCCNHPFLLKGVENEMSSEDAEQDEVESLVNASGKFVLLDKLLPRLRADGHRILLFSQFKIMLDIIEDYLELRGFKQERIDGSITGLQRQAAIDRFQSDDGSNGREQPFIMLLSTRAGGVGINLTAADTCIIFDSDWNPQNDLQAQARCHRIGQEKNVKIYRLLTCKTYEMKMFHMASIKLGLDQAVLHGIENNGGKDIMTKQEMENLLKHGAYDIFQEDKDGTSEKKSHDFVTQDIDSILAHRAKTVVHDNTGSNSNTTGGTFSKASFTHTTLNDLAVAEVDLDDPEFWTKVVGEIQEQEVQELGKRKRVQGSYSEKEYLKKLDAAIQEDDCSLSNADDVSQSSAYSDSSEDSSEESEDEDPKNEILKATAEAVRSQNFEIYIPSEDPEQNLNSDAEQHFCD